MKNFYHYRQHDAMDCGPTCIKMIASYYGKTFSIDKLRQASQYSKEGVSLLGIAEAAEKFGFLTMAVELSLQQLVNEVTLPAILHWNQNHFVVVYKADKQKITIADPSEKGIVKLTKAEFLKHWQFKNQTTNEAVPLGIALLLEPTAQFENQENDASNKVGWNLLLHQLLKQKRLIVQLFFGLLLGSILQLIFPFLTKSIVDTGIDMQNIPFLYIILLAQSMLILSRTVVDFIRTRLLLYISTSINFSLLSSFWIKLMKLPISYFDTKKTGDIQQRLSDQKRIESFLTGSALSTFFSLFNLILFSGILLYYNSIVFVIFMLGSVCYLIWIKLFFRFRRTMDYERFTIASKENTATMQLIYGMQEIKLNNSEQLRRWEWEELQAGLFKLQFRSLTLSQWQQAGAFFINEGKNILITFFVSRAVITGQLSLGEMLAVQYIIGQVNSPVEQLVGFSQQFQDAKLSLERLNEIYEVEDEEPVNREFVKLLPSSKSISLENVSFTYPGAGNEPVLENVYLQIPEGKVTAIVGMSGSGKTTLLKLLLKFYENYKGTIKLGETSLQNIGAKNWRSHCGSVMQDGYIFNDSIAKNIAVSDLVPNYTRLYEAARIANIQDFIEALPLGYETKIGAEGNGISAGQRQRILMARAIYKNPSFLFLDEATNALDANNEKMILENLQHFFKNRTVIVIAHRLSTVRNADLIIVLDKGKVIESGNHHTLAQLKGKYYELVKNQLEMGN
ncbi:MAG: peptidase domain-containing ABC transporter [Bacteroidia bacterium]|nr:peptidase domain-containing ABC transporter [Bacteroidia bacterium]